MKKEYVYRYIIEGTVVLDDLHSSSDGQKQLGIELACGNVPAQRRELVILSERTISDAKEAG